MGQKHQDRVKTTRRVRGKKFEGNMAEEDEDEDRGEDLSADLDEDDEEDDEDGIPMGAVA